MPITLKIDREKFISTEAYEQLRREFFEKQAELMMEANKVTGELRQGFIQQVDTLINCLYFLDLIYGYYRLMKSAERTLNRGDLNYLSSASYQTDGRGTDYYEFAVDEEEYGVQDQEDNVIFSSFKRRDFFQAYKTWYETDETDYSKSSQAKNIYEAVIKALFTLTGEDDLKLILDRFAAERAVIAAEKAAREAARREEERLASERRLQAAYARLGCGEIRRLPKVSSAEDLLGRGRRRDGTEEAERLRFAVRAGFYPPLRVQSEDGCSKGEKRDGISVESSDSEESAGSSYTAGSGSSY
ncbi:MAG: hypothetical protein A3E87_00725 [Gammaproteobacteria bacterium RIFCSPHIGHO2_12_FULL_35_23]|nr:MAG: hypothetical protein A3E87_00725 [Gammaproteobacteria bacterium RIFCSPHIGHO2_12_FULL_35_23]